MRALIVYESSFGNTRRVAEAIAAGIGDHAEVEVADVRAPAGRGLRAVDLLVVGAPTHAFGLSRPSTRRDAVGRGAPTPAADGLREWIGQLEQAGADAPAVAVFDTRMTLRWLPGGAAPSAARRLRGRGYRLVGEPTSFFVTDVAGPLVDGEEQRARAWGADLLAALEDRSTAQR